MPSFSSGKKKMVADRAKKLFINIKLTGRSQTSQSLPTRKIVESHKLILAISISYDRISNNVATTALPLSFLYE